MSLDSKKGYDKQNKGNANANTDTAVEQAETGFPQTVQNAGERCVQVQKRADKGQSLNADAGGGVVK